MRIPPSKSHRTLKEILDSDDELSTDYEEPQYMPACLNDYRFEHLRQKNNGDHLKDKHVTKNRSKKNVNKVIQGLVMNKTDFFCFQCMQRDSIDICKWFLKFTLYKDLQSNYKFLQPCLIPRYKKGTEGNDGFRGLLLSPPNSSAPLGFPTGLFVL